MARFDKRIKVQRQSRDLDEGGNELQTWSDLKQLWASVRETPGREAIVAGRVTSSHTATVWLRTGPTANGLTAQDRVIYRGQVWDILNAHPGEGAGIIELLIETDGGTAP